VGGGVIHAAGPAMPPAPERHPGDHDLVEVSA
jgi:hypothetical protein